MFGLLTAFATIALWDRFRPATSWHESGLQTVKLVCDLIGGGAGWLAAWMVAQTLGWQGAEWQAAACVGILAGRASAGHLRTESRVSE